MSTIENKWKQSKRLSSSQRVRSETGSNQAPNTYGSAWNRPDSSQIVPGGRSIYKIAGSPGSQIPTNTSSGVVEEVHVPVRKFNSSETSDFLLKALKDLLVTDAEKKCLYRPALDANAPKSPWGSKPTVMTSGQDFWVQLGKQLNVKEH